MSSRHQQRGATLIEILVSMIVSVIGLLGMLGLQLRAYASDAESFQRTHATILLQDMADRISANRANAAAYVGNDIGVGNIADCTAAANIAARDLCEWANLLRGSAEIDTESDVRVGAMRSARACITSPAANTYVVAVVWEGVTKSAAPNTTCGQGQYSHETLRRAVTTIVRIADLDA